MGKASDPRVGRDVVGLRARHYCARIAAASAASVSSLRISAEVKARNETYFFNSAAEFVDIQERFITRLRDFCFLSQFGDLGWHTLPAASSWHFIARRLTSSAP